MITSTPITCQNTEMLLNSQLCHRDCHEQHESAQDRPADCDPRRAARVPREREVVKHPARTEMIVNEIAKFVKLLQPRASSCL